MVCCKCVSVCVCVCVCVVSVCVCVCARARVCVSSRACAHTCVCVVVCLHNKHNVQGRFCSFATSLTCEVSAGHFIINAVIAAVSVVSLSLCCISLVGLLALITYVLRAFSVRLQQRTEILLITISKDFPLRTLRY